MTEKFLFFFFLCNGFAVTKKKKKDTDIVLGIELPQLPNF